ncbi:MAG: DNA polymerase III subunit alpha, partial [Bacteroidota bacterium]
MYLIFDTETTGIPRNKTAPLTDFDNWPRLVQLAWQLHGPDGKLLNRGNEIIRPDGFDIPFKAQQVHGISTARATADGKDLKAVLETFSADLSKADLIIGHNIEFDISIIGAELLRTAMDTAPLLERKKFDTSTETIAFCALPGGPGGKFKMPKLNELHQKLFGKPVQDAHDAAYDVDATARCFFGLLKEKVAKPADGSDPEKIKYQAPKLESANFSKKEQATGPVDAGKTTSASIAAPFVHLHLHSQYSVLQATADVADIVAHAKSCGMEAVALTDLGNLYGAFAFVAEASKAKIKPIVGCEFFLSEERKKNKFTKDSPDRRYNQVLIAKDEAGYRNLSKLSSLGFIEGLYGIHPRIDKELVSNHCKGLIATTGGLNSEIPYLILNSGMRQAEAAFRWWMETFGSDFYVELNRHGLPEEDHVNTALLELCRKYGVKYFPANEVYYLKREDANAHDVLLCIKEGEFKSTPVGHGFGKRYGLPNNAYYFKTQEEMRELFRDLPEAFDTLQEINAKISTYLLERSVLLPKFDIPSGFDSQDDYLRHITFEGAKKRYPDLTQAIRERLDFELETIKKTGYPGYFLIVADFTAKARELGVSVGPGRGSAAGSAVAYCTGITNVDPIRYDLLFERFLNPDRVSLPDIDIDFDDEGREKVIEYVINKYGASQVAQIITYGTMAAKSSIRDCARVMELPLNDANTLAKLVPEKPGTTLSGAFDEVAELKDLLKGQDLKAQVLKQAKIIEGSVRSTGTHACGVIITPQALTELIPVSTAKDSTMLVTQFDNSVVEKAGMLKMDFLGLTTLSIIKTALRNIKRRHNKEIDIEQIPLDDAKTYQLYQRGETTGTFQFESDGMQAYLRQLKPDKFEDLIAM